MKLLTHQSILDAQNRIDRHIIRTPLCPCPDLSDGEREVRLKLETVQHTGAFKYRGATNAVLALNTDQRKAGVTCASTGNHGRALAQAAAQQNIKATICMSKLVPRNKLEAIEKLGAEIRIVGDSQDDAQHEVDRLVANDGMVEVPPFDHADVIAGQGTIGLELLEDWPDLDTVLVPLSGGGLIGGIALALKSANPKIAVIGISMKRGAAMHASMQNGKPTQVVEEPSLADSLGGGIGLDNRYTFDLARRYVDDIVLLNEHQIASGMQFLYRSHGLVTEGAASVSIPVLTENLSDKIGKCVAAIISGRNVSLDQFEQVQSGILPSGQ